MLIAENDNADAATGGHVDDLCCCQGERNRDAEYSADEWTWMSNPLDCGTWDVVNPHLFLGSSLSSVFFFF